MGVTRQAALQFSIIFLLSSGFIGCATDGAVAPASSWPKVVQRPDGSSDYYFENNRSCHKRADFTKFVDSQAAIKIKDLFDLSGKFQQKWENAKKFSPKFEELEAVFFNYCLEYGKGVFTKDEYLLRLDRYDLIRQEILKTNQTIAEVHIVIIDNVDHDF